MIVTETVKINGKNFTHNYSDENFYIRKVGTDEIYSDVYDLPRKKFTYEETEDKIEEVHFENKDKFDLTLE